MLICLVFSFRVFVLFKYFKLTEESDVRSDEGTKRDRTDLLIQTV